MSFCRFPQLILFLLIPSQVAVVGSSQIIRIHLAGPEGGKAKHCNSERQKHLSTAKDSFWFRSCKNVFPEPENQHDSMMPSARRINDYALQAINVFPFQSCHLGLCVFSDFLDVVSEAHKYTLLCISHVGRNCLQTCCEMRSLERRGL